MMTGNSQKIRRRSFKMPIILSLLSLLILVGAVSAAFVMTSNSPRATQQPQTAPYSASSKSNVPQGPALTSDAPTSAPLDSVSLDQAKKVVDSVLNPKTTMSGGGCYSYTSSSPDATVASSGSPQMYGFEGSNAPFIGLTYNRCDSTIIVSINAGYDYYKVNWWRPGRSGWTQYRTSYTTSTFTNAHAGTYYQFTIEGCISHWYGDSCKSWSPRVNIYTN